MKIKESALDRTTVLHILLVSMCLGPCFTFLATRVVITVVGEFAIWQGKISLLMSSLQNAASIVKLHYPPSLMKDAPFLLSPLHSSVQLLRSGDGFWSEQSDLFAVPPVPLQCLAWCLLGRHPALLQPAVLAALSTTSFAAKVPYRWKICRQMPVCVPVFFPTAWLSFQSTRSTSQQSYFIH